MSETFSYDPIDFGFHWVSDWYEFDYKKATELAKARRNQVAKEFKQAGKKVKLSSDKQLRTMGGIGSGHPQIEEIVMVYYVTVL